MRQPLARRLAGLPTDGSNLGRPIALAACYTAPSSAAARDRVLVHGRMARDAAKTRRPDDRPIEHGAYWSAPRQPAARSTCPPRRSADRAGPSRHGADRAPQQSARNPPCPPPDRPQCFRPEKEPAKNTLHYYVKLEPILWSTYRENRQNQPLINKPKTLSVSPMALSGRIAVTGTIYQTDSRRASEARRTPVQAQIMPINALHRIGRKQPKSPHMHAIYRYCLFRQDRTIRQVLPRHMTNR